MARNRAGAEANSAKFSETVLIALCCGSFPRTGRPRLRETCGLIVGNDGGHIRYHKESAKQSYMGSPHDLFKIVR
jgi:hypothetical protein